MEKPRSPGAPGLQGERSAGAIHRMSKGRLRRVAGQTGRPTDLPARRPPTLRWSHPSRETPPMDPAELTAPVPPSQPRQKLAKSWSPLRSADVIRSFSRGEELVI